MSTLSVPLDVKYCAAKEYIHTHVGLHPYTLRRDGPMLDPEPIEKDLGLGRNLQHK